MRREFTRSDRLSAQIRRVLGTAIRQLQEEGLMHVAVSDVEVTRDLSLARVYINVLDPATSQRVLKQLKEHAGRLRKAIAQDIRARRIPELRFIYDDSLERGKHLESLIEYARVTDKQRSPEGSDEGSNEAAGEEAGK